MTHTWKAGAAWADRFIRLGITFLFLKAGWDKLIDPEAFASSIQGYQMVPLNITVLMTWFLPWLEVWSSLALWVNGALRKAAWLLIMLMLILFTIAKVSAVMRGLDISCGCTSSSTPLTWWSVAENTGWILLASLGIRLEVFLNTYSR